jgi:galactonate dehydratase
MTTLTDAWFSPRSLTCYEVRVRPLTTWAFIELRDDSGLAGLAEITYAKQDAVVSVMARLANRLRGEKLRSEADVLVRLGLTPSALERDIVTATAVSGIRSALVDALARRSVLSLADFLLLAEGRRPDTPAAASEKGDADGTPRLRSGRANGGQSPAIPAAALFLAATPGPAATVPRVELYANINRALLPKFAEKSGMPPEPSDRSPDGFAAMAKRAVAAGFRTVKCAPFDECRAPSGPLKDGTPARASTGSARPVSLPYTAGTGTRQSREMTGGGLDLPREAEPGLERVHAVKEAIGAERNLYVDCHSRFDLTGALALEPELRAAGAAWYEEPVDPLASPDDMRRIRERAHLPIAGGENGYGLAVFGRLLRDEVVDIVMPDVKHCGGAVEAYRIGVELERENTMDRSSGSGWLKVAKGCVSMHCPSGPVSLLASGHVTHALVRAVGWGGGGPLPLEHAVYEADWRSSVLEPEERVEGGALLLPDGPGLGAGLDYSTVLSHGRKWEP